MVTTRVSQSDTVPSTRSQTISLAELAGVLGIGKTACYELAQRDELPVPVLRIGRQYRFSKQALDQLLAAQHVPTSTERA